MRRSADDSRGWSLIEEDRRGSKKAREDLGALRGLKRILLKHLLKDQKIFTKKIKKIYRKELKSLV